MFSASEKVFGGFLIAAAGRPGRCVLLCAVRFDFHLVGVGYKINRRRLPKERSILPLRCAALSVVDGHF